MDHEQFVDALAWRAALTHEDADAVSKMALQMLAEQVSARVMNDVLDQLPSPLDSITPVPPAQQREISVQEFSTRLSQLAGVDDPDRGLALMPSVFAVVGEACGPERLRAAVAGLPLEYQSLLPGEGRDADEFVAHVQRRAQLWSREVAAAGTRATLAALAASLSEERARELGAALPPGLHPHLDTGRGDAQHFDEPGFLDRVGSQAGLAGDDTAERHVRAVLATLTAWAPRPVLDAIQAELPQELADMFDP